MRIKSGSFKERLSEELRKNLLRRKEKQQALCNTSKDLVARVSDENKQKIS